MRSRGPQPGDPHPPSRGEVPGTGALIKLAKRVTSVTGCPVVGGVAVVLHGHGRYTDDIDVYTDDYEATHQDLLDAGLPWNARRREHTIDGTPIHLVGPDVFGEPTARTSTIRGVKVISLRDLVRATLAAGLKSLTRAQDLADVVELVRAVPLDKSFAAKLPTSLRAPFKEIVEQIHGPRRTTIPPMQFWKKYA
jgi:CBS domain-containing protein